MLTSGMPKYEGGNASKNKKYISLYYKLSVASSYFFLNHRLS